MSIDLPSGIDTDTGALPGPAVRARRTFTLCRPKPGLVLEPAASHAGSWSVIGIGIPDEAVAREAPELVWFDGAEAAALVPDRPPDAHKGTFGHLLAVCGSKGKTGAAVLAARGALRSGVGLVTVATPASILPIVAGGQPEAMTEPLPESSRGTLSRSGAARVLELLASRDALMIGPGLSTDPGTRAAVLSILARRNAPAVLDADGLNAAASVASRTKLRAGRHPLVLTPHPGEAARLLGIRTDSVQADRLGSAHALAIATSAVVVLKGRHSIVAEAGGRASFNATGNPGMATGGTGDALTGVIGALLARGLPAFDAARLGTYVHGAAGDAAAERTGPQGLIAGDLIEALPAVWGRLAAMRRGVDPWTREA